MFLNNPEKWGDGNEVKISLSKGLELNRRQSKICFWQLDVSYFSVVFHLNISRNILPLKII